jgi:hypothetical protein
MRFQGRIEKGKVVLDGPLPDGTPVCVEEIAPTPTDFWQSSSVDELERQGVPTPGALEERMGGWPVAELYDDFEEIFLGWRERELEQRP